MRSGLETAHISMGGAAMRRMTVAFGMALALGVAMVGTTGAWPDRFEGRPEQLEVGGDAGFYIWHADDGVHLSTTGPGPRRDFRAVIRTDGEFEDIDQLRLDEGDRYAVRDGGGTLVVDFTTFGHTDNIRWRIAGGTHMRFDLTVDEHPIAPQNVYLGAEGYHPPRPHFRLPR